MAGKRDVPDMGGKPGRSYRQSTKVSRKGKKDPQPQFKVPKRPEKHDDVPRDQDKEREESKDPLQTDQELGQASFTPKEFDINNIEGLDCFIICVGKRRFGKTTWSRDVLSQIWQFFPDGGFVFTKTKQNKYWSQHFPENRYVILFGG